MNVLHLTPFEAFIASMPRHREPRAIFGRCWTLEEALREHHHVRGSCDYGRRPAPPSELLRHIPRGPALP